MQDLSHDITELVRPFAEREAGNAEVFPAQNLADLYRAGIPGAPFAAAHGGRGASLTDCVRATEAVAAASASTALLLSMPLGLAGVYTAAEEVVAGEHRTSFFAQLDEATADYRLGRIYAACNSERGAGGSLAATKAVVDIGADGRPAISGEKILASSGLFAYRFFSTARVGPGQLAGAADVEFFLVRADGVGVEILDDWDGFGMRSTESQTVRYSAAPVDGVLCYPDLIARVQPLQYFYCLFAGVSLGAVRGMMEAIANPAPASPALRLRFAEATMRYEAMRAYLAETAGLFRPAAGPAYAARVLRMKTYVTQESTRLAAELFALSGGRHYRRSSPVARAFADSFAGTALRPPLALALDTLLEEFSLPGDEPGGQRV